MIKEMFPYLRISDAPAAIDFYKQVFGATEKFRLTEPGGRIGHAELELGGSTLMLSEAFPEYGIKSASQIGDSAVAIHLHVDDADAVIQKAVDHGATLEMAPQDQFYGERSGRFRDPFGHIWLIGHHLEDLSTAEMQRRYDAMFAED